MAFFNNHIITIIIIESISISVMCKHTRTAKLWRHELPIAKLKQKKAHYLQQLFYYINWTVITDPQSVTTNLQFVITDSDSVITNPGRTIECSIYRSPYLAKSCPLNCVLYISSRTYYSTSQTRRKTSRIKWMVFCKLDTLAARSYNTRKE